MSKLIIHKNLTSQALFRVTGGNIYNRPGWDIARNKSDLVAYLTQFQPEVISIGHIEEMTAIEIADFIIALCLAAGIKRYPKILVVDNNNDVVNEVNKKFGIVKT